jgi:uncharacterized protein (TIGR00369 family)
MAVEGTNAEMLREVFTSIIPHNRALGMTLVEVTDTSAVTLKLPWRAYLVGNPATGVMHGGVVTTLLDACCGVAVFVALRSPEAIATLDLRIDFFEKAPAGHDIFARAECYRLTRSVAFVRATAWAQDVNKPFAAATSTFAVATPGPALTQGAS